MLFTFFAKTNRLLLTQCYTHYLIIHLYRQVCKETTKRIGKRTNCKAGSWRIMLFIGTHVWRVRLRDAASLSSSSYKSELVWQKRYCELWVRFPHFHTKRDSKAKAKFWDRAGSSELSVACFKRYVTQVFLRRQKWKISCWSESERL